MNNRYITIKISGEEHQIKQAIAKIESQFPLCITGQIIKNGNDENSHVFLTAVILEA